MTIIIIIIALTSVASVSGMVLFAMQVARVRSAALVAAQIAEFERKASAETMSQIKASLERELVETPAMFTTSVEVLKEMIKVLSNSLYSIDRAVDSLVVIKEKYRTQGKDYQVCEIIRRVEVARQG